VRKLLCSNVLFVHFELQQLLCNIIFTWESNILRSGFKVNTMCGWHLYCTKSSTLDKEHDLSYKSFRANTINEPVVTCNKLRRNFVGLVAVDCGSPFWPRWTLYIYIYIYIYLFIYVFILEAPVSTWSDYRLSWQAFLDFTQYLKVSWMRLWLSASYFFQFIIHYHAPISYRCKSFGKLKENKTISYSVFVSSLRKRHSLGTADLHRDKID
jgi:hypothetical protein